MNLTIVEKNIIYDYLSKHKVQIDGLSKIIMKIC